MSSAAINALNHVRVGLSLFGLIGNSLSFLVFSRRTFKKNSINVYCRALAVIDSTYILVQLINDLAQYAGIQLYPSVNALCKLSFYIYVSIPSISGWTLAALSVDKAVSVVYVNRISFLRKLSFQLGVIISIVVINLLVYISVPIGLNSIRYENWNNQTNTTQVSFGCTINNLSFIRVINYLFLIESSLVPFAFMLAATCVITVRLYQSRTRVFLEKDTNSGKPKNRRLKDRKFAYTSAILNIIFVIFQIPIVLTYLIDVPNLNTYLLFYLSAIIALNMNLCMPFIIYLISNSIFRRQFLSILGLRTKFSSPTTAQSVCQSNVK